MKAKMRRFLSLMLAIVLVFGMVPMDAYATEGTGDGNVIVDNTGTEVDVDKAVEAVQAMVDALVNMPAETDDDIEALRSAHDDAKTAYDALSEEQKQNVVLDEFDAAKEILDAYDEAKEQGTDEDVDVDGASVPLATSEEGGEAVAKIGEQSYTTFDDALTAASAMNGEVTVEIYGKVTLNQSLSGSYTSIKFVGKNIDAEIYLDVQGYITATGKKVTFEDLTLSKSAGGYITNAGFMNVAFGVYDVSEVTYTDCAFANGAYASAGKVTFNGCTFYRSHDKYGLWAYGDVDVTVSGCIFNNDRGIKMYAEGAAKTVDLTVKNTDFSAVNDKPAIVLTYGESVTLENNTYSSTGTFELDLDGTPNGTEISYTDDSGDKLTCVNDNGACGVLVDGQIYTTVAQAAEAATEDSTVTLLHSSTETVALPEGVTLDKNGYTADSVTVKIPTTTELVAKIGDTTYTSLQEALDAAAAGTGEVIVEILKDVDLTEVDWNPVTVSAPGYPKVTVNGNYKTITGLNDMLFAGTWAGKSGLIINDLTIKESNIVNDENDAKGTVGVGAFIGYPQASETVTLNNCHLVNSTVSGGHWTGGLIGAAAGYAGTDGPVFMNLTIKDCSVTGSTITGKGSVGGVIGHGTQNGWTQLTIENTTISDNTVTSTGSSTNKAGAVMGTIGAAGQPTIVNGETLTGGVSVDATVSGNTVTSNGTTINTIYGRQGTTTGVLTLTGGSYDSYPIEVNVTYATTKEGYEVSNNGDGTFGIKESVSVAEVGGVEYTDLHEAMVAAKAGETVKLLADVDLAGTEWEPVSFKGKFDGQNHVISNLTINKPGVSNTGFITSLNGEFKNVIFTNPTVTGGACTGVVAGRAGGSAALAENITVNGTIKVETTHSGYARAGVIVGGWAYGNYKNITVDGGDKVVSYIKHTGGGDGRYVAGIVGHADDVDSYVNCTVKNITISGGWLCGGIAGPGPSNDLVSGCTVENIDVNADYSGGMFGWYYGDGTIENSTVKDVTFTDGSTNNGAIGGYSNNTAANLNNVTVENVKNKDGAPLLNHVAQIIRENETINYESVAVALEAAQDKDTIKLLWAEGDAPIAMNGAVYGKTVTITGTATVDWSKGFLFVGRGGEGNGTVIFKDANLTSASNNASTGIHVSGREKNTDNKYDGMLVINDSTIELDYLINKGTMTLDNSTLTVKNGFSIGGRPASETESGKDATATITLNKGSKLVVNNHNGMGLGYEAIGVMNVNEDCTFECTQNFLVTEKGTLQVNKGTVAVDNTLTVKGTLVSNGDISGKIEATETANIEISGGKYTQDVSEWCVDNYIAIADLNGNYVVGEEPTATINNLGAKTLKANEYHVYDGSYKEGTEDMPLNFVMQFLADQTEEDMETSPYADWYADFVITVTGIENGNSFKADGCYLAGYYEPFGWVKVPIDEMEIKEGANYPVMLGVGMGQKYDYVCSGVQDFLCAMYLTPEILAANPNLKVNLKLAVVDNSKGEEEAAAALVEGKLTYQVAALDYNVDNFLGYVASIGTNKYKSLEDAFKELKADDTLTLLSDVTINSKLVIDKDLTIEGNGKTITYTGSDRAIDVPNNANKDINLTINNLTVNCAANYCERGINYNENGTLTLDNVTVKGTNLTYALNMPGKSSDATVVIEDSSFTGCIALNVWGTNSSIVAMNSEFVSVDKTTVEGYSAVVLNNDGATSAENTEIIIIGGKVNAKDEAGNAASATRNATETGNIVVSRTTEVIGEKVEVVAIVDYNANQFYSFTDLQAAFDKAAADHAAGVNATVKIIRNVEASETIKVNETVKLDLNGKTITGTDNATSNFGLIEIQPKAELTIDDTSENKTGKITLAAANNREWNAYSSVISNQRGKLIVEGGTIEHLGGTDMAYGIDNLTNGKGTYVETVINGGTIKSTYRAIRQFLNGVEAQNILKVNGGTIEGDNKSIWMQDPNKNANTGTLTVSKDAILNGDVYLYVTEGSTEWPVEVSIAAAALAEGSEVLSGNVPVGYEVVEQDGVFGVESYESAVAFITNAEGERTYYDEIDDAFKAVKSGDVLELLSNAKLTTPVELKNISVDIVGDFELNLNKMLKVFGESTLNISCGLVEDVRLEDGAIIKDSTINGNVFVAGNVTFRGDNSVNMLYDYGNLTDYYGTTAPMKWAVEEGATLKMNAKARYGLGYGDAVTIYGSIEDALTARGTLTDGDVSFFTHGIVAQESSGWDKSSSLTVKDAYVVIGSNNSFGNKPGSYGGEYTFNFENVVLDSSRITFYEALSTTEFNFVNSDVEVGTFMTNDADSTFNFDNTKVVSTTTTNGTDEGNYHAGEMVLKNSSITYSAPFRNKGEIQLGMTSSITAPAITGDGTFVIDAADYVDGQAAPIIGNALGFTGTIEVINNDSLEAKIDENGNVVLCKKETDKVAMVGDVKYETVVDAVEACSDNGVADTITVTADSLDEGRIYLDELDTLDLNGFTVNASRVQNWNGSTVVDSSANNNGRLQATKIVLAENNTELPILTEDGYLFTEVVYNYMFKDDGTYVFKPLSDELKTYFKDGAADNGVEVIVRLAWTNSMGGTSYQDFNYPENLIENVYTNGTAFSLSISASEEILKTLTYTTILESTSGVIGKGMSVSK